VKVVNLVRRQSAADALAAEGVAHVLATEDDRWASRVAELTGGAPLVRAVDSVGGKTASDLIDLLAPGGTLISFGALSGQPLQIDARQLIFKQKAVKGFWALARTERSSAADRVRMIGELVRLVASGALPLRVAATFALERAAEAAAASGAPGRPGKIALRAG
jgi:NADPH2:quinone reductase